MVRGRREGPDGGESNGGKTGVMMGIHRGE